jgi:hypothetical protein
MKSYSYGSTNEVVLGAEETFSEFKKPSLPPAVYKSLHFPASSLQI